MVNPVGCKLKLKQALYLPRLLATPFSPQLSWVHFQVSPIAIGHDNITPIATLCACQVKLQKTMST